MIRGPPALTAIAAKATRNSAVIANWYLFLSMAQLASFDPFVFDSTSHEGQETVCVDRTFLCAQQSFVFVVEESCVHLDIFEQTLVARLAYRVSVLEHNLPLTEPDGRLKSGHRR